MAAVMTLRTSARTDSSMSSLLLLLLSSFVVSSVTVLREGKSSTYVRWCRPFLRVVCLGGRAALWFWSSLPALSSSSALTRNARFLLVRQSRNRHMNFMTFVVTLFWGVISELARRRSGRSTFHTKENSAWRPRRKSARHQTHTAHAHAHPKHTMVLLGLGVCQGFRKQLHTSPYVLENEVEENTKASARAFTPRDFTPPQYFLLGFKDRDLEDEYLDDLCRISKNQIILGYSMCLLLVILGWFISYWLVLNVGYEIILGDLFNLKYTFFVENLVCHVIALLLFIGGLLGCVLVYRMDRFRAKRAVLHVTETVFLLFTVVMAYDFSRGKFPIMGERPSGWAINLAFYYLPPFVIFFFKSMPFAQTLEIITLAILTFIVIVPLASGYFGSDRVGEYIERRKDLSNARVCKEFYNLCAFDFTISLVWPVCVIVLMGVQICIVSFFVDRTNRRAFVNKRLVEVQQIKLNHSNKQKERMLKRQKKDQEDLIYSIFPKVIAKDLIAKQARKNQMEEVSATLAVSKSPTFKKTLEDVKSDAIGSLGRTVARMHPVSTHAPPSPPLPLPLPLSLSHTFSSFD